MKKVALVTGASGGIGLEIARVLALGGHDLVLVARDQERLERARTEISSRYPVAVKVVPLDLSGHRAAEDLFEMLQREGLFIEVLVNNAGIGSFGPFADVRLTTHEQLIDLNVRTLTQLTHLFLKPMLSEGKGKILQVASTAAFQPGPLMAVYYATKSYVLSFSEALANELRGTGVTVTTLCPGPTETDFKKHADLEQSKLFRRAMMDARTVAEIGVRGMNQGKAVVIAGFRNKLLANSSRFAPRGLVTRVVRRIQERAKSA